MLTCSLSLSNVSFQFVKTVCVQSVGMQKGPAAICLLSIRVRFIGLVPPKILWKDGARLIKCSNSTKNGASVYSWVSNGRSCESIALTHEFSTHCFQLKLFQRRSDFNSCAIVKETKHNRTRKRTFILQSDRDRMNP